jgi:hypothetical protein
MNFTKLSCFVALLFFTQINLSFAGNFKPIFESVSEECKVTFEKKAKKLFNKKLEQLARVLREEGSKTVFIAHDLSSRDKKDQLIQIDTQLKLAGIHSLLDLVDLRSGRGLSIHQFFDQIFDSRTDSIIVVGSGGRVSDFTAGNLFSAQSKKRGPITLLTLGDLDLTHAFPQILLEINDKNLVQVIEDGAKIQVHTLIQKTYVLISIIYDRAIHSRSLAEEISQSEESLYSDLKTLAKDESKPRKLCKKKSDKNELQHQDDLADLEALLFGKKRGK